MATTTEQQDYGEIKEQVLGDTPKRIVALEFGVLSPEETVSQSVASIDNRNLYEIGLPGQARKTTKSGPLDGRLGTSSKSGTCSTCHENLTNCNGHFGNIKLTLPAYHYGYFRKIMEVLSCVCKDCSRILLPEKEKRKNLKSLRATGEDTLRKAALVKKIVAECKKCKLCPHCSANNGPIKKVAGHPIKIFHNRFAAYHSSNAKSKKKPPKMEAFEKSLKTAETANQDVSRHMKRAADDLNPLRVMQIFKKIPDLDVELIGLDPHQGGRPEALIWTQIPAPPVAIRPSVAQENATTEDDLTNKLGDILQVNTTLHLALSTGQTLAKIMEAWEFLQVQIAMYIDGNLPGLGKDSNYGKTIRGFCQRLKGKQGRFRGNLSGKRVDFSGRTVISPDPNLSIQEVAVPVRVALNMTYPEKVNRQNIEKLRGCVRLGSKSHPGANAVKAMSGRVVNLKNLSEKGKLEKAARDLRIGDVVERHLEDGDVVLFNRQPSLHKLSILSHRAKIRPWRTFRLNECVCNPYNADFDGDEMNLHVPQTEEARTEAIELMGVMHNLATPKNGTPIISAIQDFITGAYLISKKDRFFNRRQFTHIVSFMFNGLEAVDPESGTRYPIQIPPPAIWKPQAYWTGKQVWGLLMKPHPDYPVNVNLDGKCKQYKAPKDDSIPDMAPDDSYLVVRNSEIMCGVMDKAIIGDGKKDSVFYVIMRDFGPSYAVAAMNRLAKLSARWLSEQGFSIGINDVYPSEQLNIKKSNLVKAAYDKVFAIIKKYQNGELKRDPGCDEEGTMENQISGILSKVRQECGDACFAELSRYNAPVTMAMCGSKGSLINVSQMVAAVGQQIIGGARVADGFQDRSLPHFPKGSRDPPSKGFVFNSFFSGLNPTEFIMHAMSGREGLVDTAVKTAETGYMSRRLMKSLEDLSAQYDGTVRNSASTVVQMRFGDDGLDPVDMEGSAKPVNFERTFTHSVATTWDNEERALLPEEIQEIVAFELNKERAKLQRDDDEGRRIAYDDPEGKSVDQLESGRQFMDTIQDFVNSKVNRIINAQIEYPGNKNNLLKISRSALDQFLALCLRKYEKSKTEAGHAVGAVGAQSIGEPGTQMTLKTFHFAGVAGMSITGGVPRIKEIINASKVISTPIITCTLESPYEETAALIAKSLVQKTYVRDLVTHIEDVYYVHDNYINMRFDFAAANAMGIRIGVYDVVNAIERSKGFKAMGGAVIQHGRAHIRVTIDNGGKLDSKGRSRLARPGSIEAPAEQELFMAMQSLKRRLPDIVVRGYPDAYRAIMKKDEKKDANGKERIDVLVEGYGLKQCMTTDGIDGIHTSTNSVMEMKEVLGIEAARSTIIKEISTVMGGMDIDPRHMQLLADVMTYKGEVLGITRFGLAKMRDSVLQLASFEKTPDHLFDAAVARKRDDISGVSECIIMGQSVGLGTGAVGVVREMGMEGHQEEAPGGKGFKSVAKAARSKGRQALLARRECIGSSVVSAAA